MRHPSFLNRFVLVRRFRDYLPQPVTVKSVNRWLSQWPNKEDQKALLDLLGKVRYINEKETRDSLVTLNDRLLHRLARSGIPPSKVICAD